MLRVAMYSKSLFREQVVRTSRKLQLWILGGWLLEIWKTAAELKVKNMNLDFLSTTYDK